MNALGIVALADLDLAYVVATALAGGSKLGSAAVVDNIAGVVRVVMAALGIWLLLRLQTNMRGCHGSILERWGQ